MEIDDEVAVAPDQDRDGHGCEPAAVLEGLELVELEGPADPASGLGSLEHALVEEPAVQPEELQSASDGSASAVKDASGLTVRDLGEEEAEELEMEVRLSETVVEPEGLDGEGSRAGSAAEALDGAPVAIAAEVAVESVAEWLAGTRRADTMRTTKRSVTQGILLAEA